MLARSNDRSVDRRTDRRNDDEPYSAEPSEDAGRALPAAGAAARRRITGQTDPRELRLMAKAARLYHERGLNQTEIGERLDLSQATVSRLLKRAAERCRLANFDESELQAPRRRDGLELAHHLSGHRVLRVPDHGHGRQPWNRLLEQLQPFARHTFGQACRKPSQVSPWPR